MDDMAFSNVMGQWKSECWPSELGVMNGMNERGLMWLMASGSTRIREMHCRRSGTFLLVSPWVLEWLLVGALAPKFQTVKAVPSWVTRLISELIEIPMQPHNRAIFSYGRDL